MFIQRARALIVGNRSFSGASINRGLFKDYLSKLSVPEITSKELANLLQTDAIHGPPSNFHLLDVRETYEWNEDHIPHAVYTGRGNLERDIEGIVPKVDDEIVLYCAGGFRSLVAADTLKKMGYKNVKSLKGGIGGWKREGNHFISNDMTYSERVQKYE